MRSPVCVLMSGELKVVSRPLLVMFVCDDVTINTFSYDVMLMVVKITILFYF